MDTASRTPSTSVERVEAACSLLTIKEEAAEMRVCHSHGYQTAHEYLNSGGTAGRRSPTNPPTARQARRVSPGLTWLAASTRRRTSPTRARTLTLSPTTNPASSWCTCSTQTPRSTSRGTARARSFSGRPSRRQVDVRLSTTSSRRRAGRARPVGGRAR